MIYPSVHSLKFTTSNKKQKLIECTDEYTRVVNGYIKLFWDKNPKSHGNSAVIWQVESWLTTHVRRCAYKQAANLIRAAQKRNKKLNYNRYKRVYAKAKQKNKYVEFISLKWSEWIISRKLRDMVKMPKFKGDVIELNINLFKLFFDNKIKTVKSFDAVLHLNGVFRDKVSEDIPFRKHAYFNKLINNGFKVKNTINLVRSPNGHFSVRIFLEKPDELPKTDGDALGVDVGVNKMMVDNTGVIYGNSNTFKQKLLNIRNKKCGSKSHKRAVKHIQDVIGHEANKLMQNVKSNNITTLVLENIKSSKMKTKKSAGKATRKLLSHWNLALLTRRLKDKCQENRVSLVFVAPQFTSQMCSSCQETDKKSRIGEIYRCTSCGYCGDADHNAAINICNRYLNRELSTPMAQKQHPEYGC